MTTRKERLAEKREHARKLKKEHDDKINTHLSNYYVLVDKINIKKHEICDMYIEIRKLILKKKIEHDLNMDVLYNFKEKILETPTLLKIMQDISILIKDLIALITEAKEVFKNIKHRHEFKYGGYHLLNGNQYKRTLDDRNREREADKLSKKMLDGKDESENAIRYLDTMDGLNDKNNKYDKKQDKIATCIKSLYQFINEHNLI